MRQYYVIDFYCADPERVIIAPQSIAMRLSVPIDLKD